MQLAMLDWLIVAATLAVCFAPALFFGSRAGKNTSEFFASGRVGALVAGRTVDGGDHVQQRHAEPGHRHRPPQRRGRELGLVGVRAHRRVDGVLLRAAVATFGRDDRPGVLRDALFGHGGRRGARVPRGLSRVLLQLHDHGDGEPGRVQDRRRFSSASSGGRRWCSSACSTSPSPRTPACGACWSST